MWGDNNSGSGSPPSMVQNVFQRGSTGSRYWFSILPNATSTGVIKQHALRFNSTLECDDPGQVDSFICSETQSVRYDFPQSDGSEELKINLCLPQAWNTSPWKLQRSAQDISEHVFMDFNIGGGSNNTGFALSCTCNTTMGYFELPNLKNGNRPQPLVRDWPPEGLYNDCSTGACVWNER